MTLGLIRVHYMKKIVSGALAGMECNAYVTIDECFLPQFHDDVATARLFKSCAGGSDYIVKAILSTEKC